MGDGGHQRRLTVVPAGAADAGAPGGAGAAPVRPDEHPRGERPPRFERHGRALRRYLLRRHGPARDAGDGGVFAHRIQKGTAQESVLEHVPHRAFLDLGMVELQPEGRGRAFARAPVADPDLVDRLRAVCDAIPHADIAQQPDRRDGERIGTPVEPGVAAHGFAERVHHRHVKARAGERERERRSIEPAADDQDVAVACHGSNMAARAGLSMRRGTATVA